MSCVSSVLFANTYRDSVFLMKISSHLSGLEGIESVSAMMATARNKELFAAAGLLTKEIFDARPDDLVVGLRGSETSLPGAVDTLRRLLSETAGPSADLAAHRPKSICEAIKAEPGLNLAMISVPGEYAAYEAFKALENGLNVMLYSDNVSLQDELALKEYANSRGLLLMGPDCGTALLGGTPLGFVNQVRRGGLGLLSASGTGAQEVMCLVDFLGGGISHCLGLGGRDLKDEIGGLSALRALELLDRDPGTRAVVLLGKPPGPKTRQKLIQACAKLGKPVVLHYPGAADYALEAGAGLLSAASLEETAILACGLLPKFSADRQACLARLAAEDPKLPAGSALSGQWLRGVFGGGTLCLEALDLAARAFPNRLWSNLAHPGVQKLSDPRSSREHTLMDLGDDEFSRGKPHPMIDPSQRLARIHEELGNPQTAVLLLDLVLGLGSAPDQAEKIAQTIELVQAANLAQGRKPLVVASVCGSEGDNPSRAQAREILTRAGVLVCASNVRAARLAVQIIKENAA